jgi:2-oxo-4-hydroxy-4-carboxy-5-ureidoimidazoline decarboxylase
MSVLDWLNALPHARAEHELRTCCGAPRWAAAVAAARPFATEPALFEAAERAWSAATPDDVRDALASHPRIGSRSDVDAKQGRERAWSSGEQARAAEGPAAIRERITKGNARYEELFGHVFVICATGLSAEEILAALDARLGNAPDDELRIAAAEQAKITRLRLEKLLGEGARGPSSRSSITTHVLDTSRGRPACGVPVVLLREADGALHTIGRSATDADGRARDLVPEGISIAAGIHRLVFETAAYDPEGFFPEIAITFQVRAPHEHHHVPVLLSPFGFSTYRGS